MKKRIFTLLTLVIIASLGMVLLTACSRDEEPEPAVQEQATPEPSPAVVPDDDDDEPDYGDAVRELVTIRSIFPGEAPTRIDDVLAEMNNRLEEDLQINLELTWSPWSDYRTRIELGIAAGEQIDWIWSGSSDMPIFYASRIIVPIDYYVEAYGQPLRDNIAPFFFDAMRIDGQLLGIPSTANTPTVNVHNAAVYREDLRLAWGLPPINTIENLELFFEAVQENEPGMYPLLSNNFQFSMMFAFGTERFLGGTGGSTAFRINDDFSVDVMPIQEATSWIESVRKMWEWNERGFIPTDILNMEAGGMFMQGMGAVSNGSAMFASERQGEISANVPNAVLADQPFHGDGPKWLGGVGGNAVYLTPLSEHGDRVIQFWGWILTNQQNFDIFTYGIEGVDFELVGDRVSFLTDYAARFPGWMFRNNNFLRFNEAVSDEYIQAVRTWDDGAIESPLAGFTFDASEVSTELAAFGGVWGGFSPAFNAGAVDTDVLLPTFIAEATAAGQERIVEEARRQIEEFLAARN
ncbi:MAG: ABC transporter substrate-binding protein [Defluviitaleaceae bacterium]|nr:ABC transporter substrate-binding protein [Defluviitaleaceae bacterium]